MGFLQEYHLLGLVIGIATFVIIGVFHPIVVKCEYYFGTRCWWWFLVLGVLFIVAAVWVDSVPVSALLGVTGFTCLWTIIEIFEQQDRVRKGWFPRNPRRRYPFDEPER
jgi:hypothetical protein